VPLPASAPSDADNSKVTREQLSVESIAALTKRRDAFFPEWQKWYRHATEAHGWFTVSMLEIIKGEQC
jgi:hypothetical protein